MLRAIFIVYAVASSALLDDATAADADARAEHIVLTRATGAVPTTIAATPMNVLNARTARVLACVEISLHAEQTSYGDNIASMAWGARNFISTQGRAAGDLDGVIHRRTDADALIIQVAAARHRRDRIDDVVRRRREAHAPDVHVDGDLDR